MTQENQTELFPIPVEPKLIFGAADLIQTKTVKEGIVFTVLAKSNLAGLKKDSPETRAKMFLELVFESLERDEYLFLNTINSVLSNYPNEKNEVKRFFHAQNERSVLLQEIVDKQHEQITKLKATVLKQRDILQSNNLLFDDVADDVAENEVESDVINLDDESLTNNVVVFNSANG